MGLYDAIKEVEKEEVTVAAVEAPAPAPVKDEPAPVKDEPEATPAPVVTEDKPDAAAFARMRRDKAAADRRAEMLEAQLKQKPAPAAPKPADTNVEPDPQLDPEGHLRWELAQTRAELKQVSEYTASIRKENEQKALKDNAVKAFTDYEEAFAPTATDYADVTTFGVQQIAASISRLNPTLKGAALQEAVQRQVLTLAGHAERQGHDPAEHFYHLSKSWGYQPKAVEAPAAPVKPTLKAIVDHKKKASSSLAAGGKSGNTPLSREALKGMKFADVARLSPAELREWEAIEATG